MISFTATFTLPDGVKVAATTPPLPNRHRVVAVTWSGAVERLPLRHHRSCGTHFQGKGFYNLHAGQLPKGTLYEVTDDGGDYDLDDHA